MLETIEPLESKMSERPASVRPLIGIKKEPITNLNALSKKKFLPAISPLGLYPSMKTKNKSLKQESYEHPLNSFRDGNFFNLKDDWSKEGCEDMFNSVEKFLNTQLKREKSCKRRCKEIIKVRNMENTRKLIENTIRDFDEKINLNLLVKSKEAANSKGNSSSSLSDSTNYRALIAEEILRINSKCPRCREKNRRFEEAIFESPLDIQKGKILKKSTLPNLSNCIHPVHIASLHSHQYHKLNSINNRSNNNMQKMATRSMTIKNDIHDKNMLNLIQNKKQFLSKHRA